MGATFSRLKNWIAEVLTYADLNAEIDNILTNLGPAGVDDYSTNVAQMKLQTDPGGLGSESLPTSLSGEIERLRFAINRLSGETYWYEAPDSSIAELASALGGGLSSNRIASGRTVSGESQPIFLVPHGTNRTVTVKGATSNFVYYIDGVQYTIDADVVSGTLVAAPSTNNTCLVNNTTFTGQEFTKTLGEGTTYIPVDNMGSEISALVGKLAGFKVGTEYFLAKVESSTQLTKARRGFFFDSADAAISRVALTDNDTITLMKLTWVFAKTDETLTITYSNPTISITQPTSPAIGDYWFDLAADIWKYTLDGSTWINANAILIGVALQDTSGTKAARGFDFFKNYNTLNTIELERISNTVVKAKRNESEISVYGSTLRYNVDFPSWDITLDLDTGVIESASTTYYLYIKESGDTVISDKAPFDRHDSLKGFYHPHSSWRAVGEFRNNASSNIADVRSYGAMPNTSPLAQHGTENIGIATAVGSSALTLTLTQRDGASHLTPVSYGRASFIDATSTVGGTTPVTIGESLILTVPSTATLGLTTGSNAYVYIYLANNAGKVELVLNSAWNPDGIVSTTAIDTSADSSGYYSVSALTNVPTRMIARLKYNTAPNGTYSAIPDEVKMGNMNSLRVSEEFITATSATKTPAGTAHFHQLTSNSIVLASPGTYRLYYSALFATSGGAATYAEIGIGVFGANGADSGSVPTLLSAVSGVTINTPLAVSSGLSGLISFLSGTLASGPLHGTPIVITTTAAVTLYVVTYSSQTTSANARVTGYISATRIK